jgi:hypothetical protein
MAKGKPARVARTLAAFRLDPAIVEGLRLVTERDGIPQSVQVRRALTDWLQKHHALPAKGRATPKEHA